VEQHDVSNLHRDMHQLSCSTSIAVTCKVLWISERPFNTFLKTSVSQHAVICHLKKSLFISTSLSIYTVSTTENVTGLSTQ
jgi:hypothetical protein